MSAETGVIACDMNQIENVSGFHVDKSFFFSDFKGVYKKKIEKRQTKMLKKFEFLKPFLKDDETILLVTTGTSSMPALEQLTTGWVIYYLKRALFVFTDKRIFHIPSTMGYKYRKSIAQVLYSDCSNIKMFGRTITAIFKNKKKERFLYINSQDKKRVKNILSKITFEDRKFTPDETSIAGRVHLCPECTNKLKKNQYICPHCQFEFKNMSMATKLSLLLPGGGYFYTGHAILGLGDAIVELILLLFVFMGIKNLIAGKSEAVGVLVVFGIFLLFEKLITIYHAKQFIKEYIPKGAF